MSAVIKGFDKPKSCLSCPFNRNDCWCSITHGGIDRDDYNCDKPCPIKSFNSILDKIRAEIDIARFIDKDTKLCKNANASGLEVALKIIDKYKSKSEG